MTNLKDRQTGKGFSLSLSGGGFRALLFHLGVVRFLHDAGILKQVRHIVAVSGGSILAAHMLLNWNKYIGSSDDFDEESGKIIDFVQQDVRGAVTRRAILGCGIPSTSWLLRRYLSHLYDRRTLNALGTDKKSEKSPGGSSQLVKPEIDILATNYTKGTLTSFSSEGVTFDRLDPDSKIFKAGHLKVDLAVAASAAYPPFFNPVKLKRRDLSLRNDDVEFDRQLFVDGGVIDNSGSRVLLKKAKSNECVPVVSDAGSEMDWNLSRFSISRGALRAAEILMARVADLEFEAFERGPDGKIWLSINSPKKKKKNTDNKPTDMTEQTVKRGKDGIKGEPWMELRELLPQVRTDLDRFSDFEVDILVRHGYLTAKEGLKAVSYTHLTLPTN